MIASLRCFRKSAASLKVSVNVKSLSSSVAAMSVEASPEHVKRITYPGSRMLLLNQPETGNPLNMSTVKDLNHLLITSDRSESVSVVFFSSANDDVFSTGVSPVDFVGSAQHGSLLKHIQTNANFIREFNKPTVAMYMGAASGSSFGLFAGSQYRLGSPSCSLVVDELARGQLPMGGLAYHLARGCAEGCAAARYVGVSKRRLYAHDLLSLGMLSHLVGDHPYDTLSFALSQTVGETSTELTKARYVSPVDAGFLRELIDDMDVRDPTAMSKQQQQHVGQDGQPVDWDVYSHPVWQQASLVPEQTLTELESSLGPVTGAAAIAAGEGHPEELADIMLQVDRCFNGVHNQTPDDAMKKLQELNAPWANAVLADMKSLDPEVLALWWYLTDGASRWTYQETLSAEYFANMNLVHKQLYKTPLDMKTVFTQLPTGPSANPTIKPLKWQ